MAGTITNICKTYISVLIPNTKIENTCDFQFVHGRRRGRLGGRKQADSARTSLTTTMNNSLSFLTHAHITGWNFSLKDLLLVKEGRDERDYDHFYSGPKM